MTSTVARCLIGLVALALGALAAHPVFAQRADTILLDGKIITLDAGSPTSQALPVRDGKVWAIGRSDDIGKLAGPQTRVINLGGRTVIPGLIDSHMHAIRAALFYATEVNWIGTHSIPEAMDRIAKVARTAKPGQWIIVAGGWTEQQFAEKRRPTQGELVAAAPEHPVYIQLFYHAALLTPAGFKVLDISGDEDVPPHGKIERDGNGASTGWILGDNPTISRLFDRLPRPNPDEKVQGTRLFFRELNRLAITAVSDPGGFNLAPTDYLPLFQLWQDHELTIRVAFSMFAQRPGKELDDYQSLTRLLPMGFGDEMLHFNGIGENVTWGMYNNESPSEADKQQLYEVLKWAVSRRMTAQFHWNNNDSVHHLLDVLERVNGETPIMNLRWSIAHLNDASVETLRRMKALGVGWLMQNAMYFAGEPFLKTHGIEAMRRTPPIVTALKLGLRVAGGTDAHRVMSYNPFVALEWMVDGKTVGGTETRGPDETPSRIEALQLYTQDSAWFTFDDDRRGSLGVGKLADLAVLSKDYMTVPAEEISGIESLLTMVGGRIVYAAEPYPGLEATRGAN